MSDDSASEEDLRAVRAEILARFETWLDAMLAAPVPPEGIDAQLLDRLMAEESSDEPPDTDDSREIDMYAMWSSIVGLTQEIKLQGRAFGRLTDSLAALSSLAALPDTFAETGRALIQMGESQDRLAGAVRTLRDEATDRVRGEVLEVLIDLRDRLGRLESGLADALHAARRPAPALGWRARLLSPPTAQASPPLVPALESLTDAHALVAERLEEELARMGMSEIICLGQEFDPALMRAVEIERDPATPSGLVTHVYRRGYRLGSRIYRLADVKVNRSEEREL